MILRFALLQHLQCCIASRFGGVGLLLALGLPLAGYAQAFLTAGPRFVFPLSDFNSLYSTNVGAQAQVAFPVAKAVNVGGSLGFLAFKHRDSTNERLLMLPFAANADYALGNGSLRPFGGLHVGGVYLDNLLVANESPTRQNNLRLWVLPQLGLRFITKGGIGLELSGGYLFIPNPSQGNNTVGERLPSLQAPTLDLKVLWLLGPQRRSPSVPVN